MCSRTLQSMQVREVIYSLCFVAFFEHWGHISPTQIHGEFSSFNRSVKDDLYYWGDLISELLKNQWSDLVRSSGFAWFEVT